MAGLGGGARVCNAQKEASIIFSSYLHQRKSTVMYDPKQEQRGWITILRGLRRLITKSEAL